MVHVLFKSAEDVANEMGFASDVLNESTNKMIDTSTSSTVSVVERSLESQELLMKLAADFHTSFNKTIEQLNSVATEFKRTDIELEHNIQQLFPLSTPFQNNLMK